MLTVERHFWLPKLRNAWQELYEANSALTVFQSYEFMSNFWKNSWVYCATHREFPMFYLIREDGIPRMIAPLCKKHDGTYEIMGNKNGCEYCDFVYAENAHVVLYVDALLKRLQRKVRFARIKEDSLLYKALEGNNCMKMQREDICVNIPMPNNYETYYKSLSSSVRQNLRTSFNRLKRDGHSISVKVLHDGKQVETWSFDNLESLQTSVVEYTRQEQNEQEGDKDFTKMLALYYQRHAERYEEQTSKLKMWYMKHLNFVTISLRHMRSAVNVMLFVDNELAAFMGGLVSDGEGALTVPRLSINGKFGFYSPGMLLVNETARYLIDRTENHNLDLSLGTEEYKMKMGGVNLRLKLLNSAH